MIVPLIPLFLAANVAVNEGDWKYGPEAIYNVQVDAAAYPQHSSLPIATNNSTLKLKCRLQYQLVLNCYFQESQHVVTLFESGKSQVSEETEDFGQHGPGKDGFQLNFCSQGLNEIVVSSSIPPEKLDMIRALVAQLNVGTDLSEQNMSTFDVVETSSAGVCNTIYDLSVNAADEDDAMEVQKNSYELVNIRGSMYPGLELKELRKTRNLDKCHYRADYFYGSSKSERNMPNVIGTKLNSSKSKMTITKNSFTSYTENVVNITEYKANITDKMRLDTHTIIRERLTLSLEDIVPADGPMPKIKNPSGASIFPTRLLRDDSSEEVEDNESSRSVS